MIEVVKPGLLTTVQDLGRPGYAHLGVSRSGALDQPALVAANRLVGNDDGAAGLETTLNGVVLRVGIDTTLAVTGAVASVSVAGRSVGQGEPFEVAAGAVVEVGPAQVGVRCYVAFAGGVAVAPVLGSRSTDTLSGLGPPPLRAGLAMPLGVVGSDRPQLPASQRRPGGDPGRADLARTDLKVRLRLGPRHDWFTGESIQSVLAGPYTFSVKSNRIGARLSGDPLTRAVAGELPSEGLVLGSVQVPGDGLPLVCLADHPTTGGYPVVGVVDPDDLPLLAQARPGTIIRFAPWI